MVKRDRNETSCSDFRIHQERRLIDQPLSGNRRGNEDIAVVDAEVAADWHRHGTIAANDQRSDPTVRDKV